MPTEMLIRPLSTLRPRRSPTPSRRSRRYASTSYVDMLKTKGNRWRLLISVYLGVFSQWSGNGVVSYYLALVLQTVGITSVTHQTLISACLQVWNLVWAVAAAACVEMLGRRPLFITSAATMLASFIVITGLSGSFANTRNSAVGVAVIPLLFVFFAGYDIALQVQSIYCFTYAIPNKTQYATSHRIPH